ERRGHRRGVGREVRPIAAAGRRDTPRSASQLRDATMTTRYECRVDTASITALDTHVHIESEHGCHSLPDDLRVAAAKYFANGGEFPGADETATMYRERSMAAVIFTV